MCSFVILHLMCLQEMNIFCFYFYIMYFLYVSFVLYSIKVNILLYLTIIYELLVDNTISSLP